MSKNQDAPPVLAELINRTGVSIGAHVAQQVDIGLRAAFSHGVAEGIEAAAHSADLFAQHFDQHVPDAPAVSDYIRQLRDYLRISALSIEFPQ